MKLLTDLGTVCSIYQDRTLRDLDCHRVQADEIWSFVGAKQKNVKPERRAEGWGDTSRLRNRVQLTTDGLNKYLLAVEGAFRGEVDYAQLMKVYGTDQDSRKPERRYSPGVCLEAIPHRVTGNPDPDHISTSHVERLNLTTRMSVRRFTRLTNAHSKKVENHVAALSLHFMHYNFCRVHQTLKTTPAVAAGVTDQVWKLDELIGLLEQARDRGASEAWPVQASAAEGDFKLRHYRPASWPGR